MLSPSDAQLAARDQRLPGLATALSAGALSALLVDAGWCAPGDALHGVYARYKPGTNCLVAYASAPGQTAQICAVAHGDDAGVKLAKAHTLPTHTGGGRSLVFPALRLAVYAFPLDRRLPQIGMLSKPCAAQALIDDLGLPAAAPGAAAMLTPVRYKPERRCVLRLAAGEHRWLVKFYAGAHAFERARRAAPLPAGAALHLAPLAGAAVDRHALAWMWLDGATLDTLPAGAPATMAAYRAAGVALAELHRRPAAGYPIYDQNAEADAFTEAAQAIIALAPEYAPRVDAILATLAAHLACLGGERALLHGDFSPDQILVAPDDCDNVTLLDLDRAGAGNPAADVGALAAWLRRRALDGAADDGALDALLAGYAAVATPPAPQAVRTHTAGRLLRLCPEVFRRRDDACWLATLDRCLSAVEEVLHEC